MSDVFRRLFRVGLLVPLMIVSLAVPSAVLADDDDDDDDDRFGAWIHAGTVEDFDEEPLFRFGSLEEEDDRDDIDEFDLSDVDASVFWEEDEDIDMSLDQLMAEPHVLVVRAENDLSSPVIAIGLIDGELDGRGELTISLQPVDDSGFAGLAHFDPDDDDDDDDETDVDIVVWEGEPVMIGTPTAG